MKEGKDIDKLFNEGLTNHDIPFNDLDWDNLEERLHPKEKRRAAPVIWLATVAGIAAVLTIVFFLAKPDSDIQPKIVKGHLKEATKVPTVPLVLKDKPEGDLFKKESQEAIKPQTNIAFSNKKESGEVNSSAVSLQNSASKVNTGIDSYNRFLSQFDGQSAGLNSTIQPVKWGHPEIVTDVKGPKLAKIPATTNKSKPRLVLSILAAPDLTSVQTSGKSSLSGSFGAELSLVLSKRWSLTTGLGYSKKIYDAGFNLYKPNSSYVFKETPLSVHANCDVLDIPINVNYKLFSNNHNSISVSTGLSTYLMLNEKYNYTYAGDYSKPTSFEVSNQNQHFLGIANIAVEFQRKINNNISLSAKPFVKLPLADIGYGNTKISSTGVALSVNMNLFRAKK